MRLGLLYMPYGAVAPAAAASVLGVVIYRRRRRWPRTLLACKTYILHADQRHCSRAAALPGDFSPSAGLIHITFASPASAITSARTGRSLACSLIKLYTSQCKSLDAGTPYLLAIMTALVCHDSH